MVARWEPDCVCVSVARRSGPASGSATGRHAGRSAACRDTPRGLSLSAQWHWTGVPAAYYGLGLLAARPRDEAITSAHPPEQSGHPTDLRHHTRREADRVRPLAPELRYRADRSAEIICGIDAVKERILACLKGIATGDAIGKQTETLSREGVLRWYPDGVRGFEGSPGAPIPRYSGNANHEWRIGETTDDTERTIAVARATLQDGDVRHASIGRRM